jgi:hypothetical protein
MKGGIYSIAEGLKKIFPAMLSFKFGVAGV